MRPFSVLLSLTLLMSLAHAQNKPEPIRLCVSTLQNSSRSAIDAKWQRDQLIRAFERNNKGKDVAKGKAPRIETITLESNSETDPAVRENDCQFILHTNVVEIIDAGTSDISDPRPHSVGIGSAPNDPAGISSNDNRAIVSYRLMRAGELEPWASGEVREHDPLPDAMLLSHLMDQTANRVVRELRERH
ncbi:MAG TPA: hypothetical protein VE866_16335 [Candidatus Binatia bacterium]|nr:hypothetical protein [Candidatus Binatia bacterium]